MALITCKDCKNLYSTDAQRCTICGARKPLSKIHKIGITVGIIWFGFAIITAKSKEEPGSTHVSQNSAQVADVAQNKAVFIKYTEPESSRTSSGSGDFVGDIDFNKTEHTIETNTFGCTDEDYYARLISYFKDKAAFQKAFITAEVAGICDTFKGGEKVYLGSMKSKYSLFSVQRLALSLTSVRRPGSIKEYWIYIKDINDRQPPKPESAIDAGIDTKGEYGRTALIRATMSKDNKIETVKQLIKKGANVNIKDDDGSTALMGAVFNNHIEIAKLLIENGADVNTKDNNGLTALMWANGHKEAEVLIQKKQDNDFEGPVKKESIENEVEIDTE